jgi:hypothetical protein
MGEGVRGRERKFWQAMLPHGDQTGRIFTQWAIVYFGQFFKY